MYYVFFPLIKTRTETLISMHEPKCDFRGFLYLEQLNDIHPHRLDSSQVV